ncbi:hypothetical protein LOCC1_G006253 [Lachnellula occidentalis]|uniref:Rhodopsin domain-containing protein n=1 Tax=Lachnellula occidentalis TaxID=215460 RepID=A0A8H8RW77_9HELO|nr:hypothetical protein LOCC1_G006253 [Lachnellula occidentalis]
MTNVGGYGPTIVSVMWVETALALLFVCLRLHTRFRITHTAGWDDYLIALSWVLLLAFSAAMTSAVMKGFGRHSTELTLTALVAATKAEIIGQTFCIIAIATSKVSVAIFLLRITIIQWHRMVLYFLMFALTIICILDALFDFIRCDPVAHVWNPTLDAKCWISTTGFTALSIVAGNLGMSAGADFVLAVLPWFILWDLQMKRKEKRLIAASMSLGLFAMAAGIIRAVALESLTSRSDYSYETVSLILWSSTELMVTILTATIPCLRPLYNEIRGHSTRSYSDNPNRLRTRSYHLNDIGVDREEDNNAKLDLGPHNDYSRTMVVGGKQDDSSDKSILAQGEGNIIRTNVISVQVDYDQEPQRRTKKKWTAPNGAH